MRGYQSYRWRGARFFGWLGELGAGCRQPSPRPDASAASRPERALHSLVAAFPVAMALGLGLSNAAHAAQNSEPLRIGSKRFTESYIVAQVLAKVAEQAATASATSATAATRVEVKAGLGNTAIVFAALRSGQIDLYPEYTGTIALEILHAKGPLDLPEMNRQLAPLGLQAALPLGFNDGYALAMPEAKADRLGIRALSDLARHPELRLGLSNEFLGRADGWPGLAQRYGLHQKPQGLDHGLAYSALAAGQIDATDIYTTDAQVKRLGLRVLVDDAGYFPRYDAVVLMRADVPTRFPAAWRALAALEGAIDEPSMIAMNARAELDGAGFERIAQDFLQQRAAGGALGARDGRAGASASAAPTASAAPSSPGAGASASLSAPPPKTDARFWRLLWGADTPRLAHEQSLLVLGAVLLAVALGVPLGVAVARHARSRAAVLAAVGVLQTLPSLALLALLIALLGQIGTVPALVALTLYALLPIVRNTCTGLQGVPEGLREAATALGLTPAQRLLHIELPLAAPTLVAGIRTASVISVGTATLAALVGAGGFGERIVTGLALNDSALLLAGAVPAALMAVLLDAAFEAAEWWRARRRRRA